MKPKIGEYYYHLKHDPEIINDHAYVITGFGFSTDFDKEVIFYKPLYRSILEGTEMEVFTRNLEDFMGKVEKDGKIFDRFTKIEDQNVIKELIALKDK